MNWGVLVAATLRLYQQAAKETWEKGSRAWPVALLPFLYGPVFILTAVIVAPLGLIGGFILGLVLALCVSSYLYFIAQVVNGNRLSLADLVESWRPCFGSVITILFFLTIVQYALELLVPPGAAGGYEVRSIINLALLVLLNPMPEIIYQGRHEGLNMLQESFDFLRESGVEWFLPLIALAVFATFFFPVPVLTMPLQIGRLTFPALGGEGLFLGSPLSLLWAVLSAFVLYALMVFRGLLFRALANSTRRQRAFRSRFS
ncbi:MAG TPA: hypothetical protein VGX03_30810 [Candidatus Binatia bacterium]|nr:hypothetical protein [Candidatus Binatia bacterium]